jgi:hypothetical protein
MATLHYPLTSVTEDTIHAIEKFAWAITARLAALVLIGAAALAIAGFVNYGPLADELSSWSPLNAMGAVLGVGVLTIALLGAAKDPQHERSQHFDIE